MITKYLRRSQIGKGVAWLGCCFAGFALPGQAGQTQTASAPNAAPSQSNVQTAPPPITPGVQKMLNKGDLEASAYRWPQAQDIFNQALMLARSTSDKRGEAWALNRVGFVYYRTSQFAAALNHYQQALSLFRGAGIKVGEANALRTIGRIYAMTGQPVKALAAFEQALSLLRANGDKAGEADTLGSTGWVYMRISQPPKALDYYQQALPLFRAVGDKRGEADTLSNVGTTHYAVGRSAQALDYYQQALPLFRAAGEKHGEASALGRIGGVYAQTGQPAKALDNYQQALALFRVIGDNRSEAWVLTLIGNAYMQTDQPDLALDYYQQALPIHRTSGNKQVEADTLGSIGMIYARQAKITEAEQAFRQALAQLETVRHDLGDLTEARITFTETSMRPYQAYLDLLLRENRLEDAFALTQKMKARALLEQLENGKADLTTRLSDDERKQLAALRARPEALNRQMIAEGVRNEVGSKQRFAALQEELRKAERDLSTFTDTLYIRHPDLAEARAVHTLTVAEAAHLLSPDTALLEYAICADTGRVTGSPRLILLVVTSDGKVTSHALSTIPQLQPLAAALHAACTNPRLAYQEQAQQMYRQLLAPAQSRLVGYKHWLICPDGLAWNVSFAALQDNAGRFVADQHTLTFAYSATGIAAALTKRARPQTSGSILALANPDFGNAARFGDDPHLPGQRPLDAPSRPLDAPSRPLDAPSRPLDLPSRDLVVQLRGGGIRALPGTQVEADALKRLYTKPAIYTGAKAQEATFKAEAGKYKYLHLASHAFFNDAAPLLSSVFLAAPPKAGPGSDEDGFLTARELLDMKLSADLVTLSACQTGQGETRGGEGIIGLTWALTVAGVPAQVVSQWSVDDVATAELMKVFYTRLKAGQEKGEALHEAAQTVRRDPNRQHPYYWAPFVLVGDWR